MTYPKMQKSVGTRVLSSNTDPKSTHSKNQRVTRTRYLMRGFFLICGLLMVMTGFAAEDSVSEQVLMIVGYDGSAWHPYTARIQPQGNIERDSWRKIEAVPNPTSVTRQSGTGNLFIKDNSGELTHYTATRQVVSPLFTSRPEASTGSYTQLRAHAQGMAMVELLQGKSRNTQLVAIDTSTGHEASSTAAPKTLIKQQAAQFHPFINQQSLFYGHVSCRLACDPVIQEVWHQNLITGKTQQLTRLNATSYLHSVDEKQHSGFISSNQRGYYHIARLDLATKEIIWLTEGQVTDSFPAISNGGDLYFIRRTPKGARLMRLKDAMTTTTESANVNKYLTAIDLPKSVKKIRYLELSDR